MSTCFKNKGLQVHEYLYDFAVDAGAQGTISLSAKFHPLPTGAIVKAATVYVATAATSGGSATVSIGLGTDVDGLVAATAVASLTENAVIVGAGAGLATYVADAAAGAVTATIATADLTAGKIQVLVEFLLPTEG